MRSFVYSILFIAAAACGTTPPTDTTDQLDAPVGKADEASRPDGTYTNASPQDGELASLTLNGDFTFSLTMSDGTIETGTYLFTHCGTNHYVRFYGDDGSEARYAWQLAADGLELERDGDDHWFAMAPAATPPAPEASCAADADCHGFLPQFCRACSDGSTACAHWSCVDNACQLASCPS